MCSKGRETPRFPLPDGASLPPPGAARIILWRCRRLAAAIAAAQAVRVRVCSARDWECSRDSGYCSRIVRGVGRDCRRTRSTGRRTGRSKRIKYLALRKLSSNRIACEIENPCASNPASKNGDIELPASGPACPPASAWPLYFCSVMHILLEAQTQLYLIPIV